MPLFDWTARDALSALRRQYLAGGVRAEMENHTLAVNFESMAAAAEVDRQLVIPQEADFIWLGNSVRPHGGQGSGVGSTSGVELAGFNLRITVFPPGRVLANHRDQATGPRGFVPILNICGRGRMPFLWPVPLVLGRGILVNFELRNRGSTTQAVHLALLGVRIRRYGEVAA